MREKGKRDWEILDGFGVVVMVGRKVIEKERHTFGFGAFQNEGVEMGGSGHSMVSCVFYVCVYLYSWKQIDTNTFECIVLFHL